MSAAWINVQRRAAYAYVTGTSTVGTTLGGAASIIAFGAERYDESGDFNANGFTVPWTGKIRFRAQIHVAQGRTVCGRAAVRAVELAMELSSGSGFYRRAGLERLFRDIQAARFHPLQRQPQHLYSGRLALGLDVDPPPAP